MCESDEWSMIVSWLFYFYSFSRYGIRICHSKGEPWRYNMLQRENVKYTPPHGLFEILGKELQWSHGVLAVCIKNAIDGFRLIGKQIWVLICCNAELGNMQMWRSVSMWKKNVWPDLDNRKHFQRIPRNSKWRQKKRWQVLFRSREHTKELDHCFRLLLLLPLC